MTQIDDQIATLHFFNEKIRELLELSFVKAVTNPSAGASIRGKRQEDGSFKIHSTVNGPSDEAIKAFVLTFRFFIQNNENISLQNMAILYDSSNIDPQQQAYFRSARNAVNLMLDSPNILNLEINGIIPTNRRIMDIFIYGGLAHAKAEKYILYKEWMSFPPAAAMLQNIFNSILSFILNALTYIKQINKTTLQQLTNTNS